MPQVERSGGGGDTYDPPRPHYHPPTDRFQPASFARFTMYRLASSYLGEWQGASRLLVVPVRRPTVPTERAGMALRSHRTGRPPRPPAIDGRPGADTSEMAAGRAGTGPPGRTPPRHTPPRKARRG